MKTEYAWVIELYRGNVLHYWAGRCMGGRENNWSADHTNAVRFARQMDADRVLFDLCDGVGRSVEHGWDVHESGDHLVREAAV